VFGSGAVAGDGAFPHGKQADQFAWMVKWGMTSAQALQSVFMTTASVLNYNWANRVGSVEKGKFADIIAVAGNPLTDVTEMERGAIRFAMQHGTVVVAAEGNEADDLAHPTQDATSPDDTNPVLRTIHNDCAVVPTEVAGVIGVTMFGRFARRSMSLNAASSRA